MTKLNPIAAYVAARLCEPSTWAGIALIAAMAGVPPGTVDVIHQVVAALIAAGAVFLPELAAHAAPAIVPQVARELPPPAAAPVAQGDPGAPNGGGA